MSEQEIMSLVNPMKFVGALVWPIWVIFCSLIANRSPLAKEQETELNQGAIGGLWGAPIYFIFAPLVLGLQLAIFFQKLTPITTLQDIDGWLLTWSVLNLIFGAIVLKTLHGWATSQVKSFVVAFVSTSAISLLFCVCGLLGLGVLLGAIDLTTFVALRLYLIDLMVNGFFLACFIGAAICFFSWLAN